MITSTNLNKQGIFDYNTQKNQLLELAQIMQIDKSKNLYNAYQFVIQNKETIFKYSNIELIMFFKDYEDTQNLIELLNKISFVNKLSDIKSNIDNISPKITGKVVNSTLELIKEKSDEILDLTDIGHSINFEKDKKIKELEEEVEITTESLVDEVEKLRLITTKYGRLKQKQKELKEENIKYKNHLSKFANNDNQNEIKIGSNNEAVKSNIIKAENIVISNERKDIYPKETFEFLENRITTLEKLIENLESENGLKKEEIAARLRIFHKDVMIKKTLSKEIEELQKDIKKLNDENKESEIKHTEEISEIKKEHLQEIEDIKVLLTSKHQNELLDQIIRILNQKK